MGIADTKMKIKARFIGKDGSMGYKKGGIYKLNVKGTYSPIILLPKTFYSEEVGDYNQIPYSSWETFENNWEIISKQK